MSAVSITPEKRNLPIPEELKHLEGWLLWRYEQHGEESKPRKVPYYTTGNPRTGEQGSALDRARLKTYAEARGRLVKRGFDGVGLAMLPDWGLTAIDIDNCIAEDGSYPALVSHLVSMTYVEVSPSGHGVRAWVRGNLGNHKSTSGPDGNYGLETFHSKGYVTVTGDVMDECELLGTSSLIADVDDYLRDVCRQRFGRLAPAEIDPDDPFVGLEPRHGMSVDEIEQLVAKLDPDMGRDQWIRVGMALHHETEGDDTGFDIWDEWSSGGAKYVGEADLRTQWASFDRRAGSRRPNVTMSSVKAMAKEVLASPAVAEEAPPAGKYRVMPADEVARQPAPTWLIKGVLPDADVAIVYGAPGSGKSFLTFDMAAAVARGVEWFGRRVRRGRVVIIAAEGGGAYGKRVEAYCRANDIDAARLPVGIINARPNIMEADEIYELAAAIKASGGASLIQIDTLAQVTPGANENSGEDMGRALANAKALRDMTGAMVMLLHHAGKDESRGARGWSGLLGAADMEMLVTRDAERNYREARITKQKDGEDGDRFAFRLGVVELGEDSDGDPVSSCVVQATETQQPVERSPDKKIKRRGQWQRHVLEVAASLDKATASMPLTDFVATALAALPEHDQTLPRLETTLTRAVRSIASERDGPLGLEKNLVIFYE